MPKEIRGPLTEKIEDLVTVLFLPLYFALSWVPSRSVSKSPMLSLIWSLVIHRGLKTDLGLLKDGSIWGWTVAVIIVAFLSKFLSCGLVAKVRPRFVTSLHRGSPIGGLMLTW